MTPMLHSYYVNAGILPRPLATFGATPQRVVPGLVAQPAGTGPIGAQNSMARGLTTSVPMSGYSHSVPSLQSTVPGPYVVLQRRNP